MYAVKCPMWSTFDCISCYFFFYHVFLLFIFFFYFYFLFLFIYCKECPFGLSSDKKSRKHSSCFIFTEGLWENRYIYMIYHDFSYTVKKDDCSIRIVIIWWTKQNIFRVICDLRSIFTISSLKKDSKMSSLPSFYTKFARLQRISLSFDMSRLVYFFSYWISLFCDLLLICVTPTGI